MSMRHRVEAGQGADCSRAAHRAARVCIKVDIFNKHLGSFSHESYIFVTISKNSVSEKPVPGEVVGSG